MTSHMYRDRWLFGVPSRVKLAISAVSGVSAPMSRGFSGMGGCLPSRRTAGVTLTWLGQAGLILRAGDGCVLIDAFRRHRLPARPRRPGSGTPADAAVPLPAQV